MERQRIAPERKAAFSRLLDDPAMVVRNALLAQFSELGKEAVDFLTDTARGANRILGLHAAWYLRKLKFDNPVEEFTAFIRSLQYELETGALLLNRTVMPDLDIGACCGELDEIAARCRELMVPPLTQLQKCKVINRVLFHEYGFRGNVENYSDPRNSLLSEVLKTRRGLPITLSIIYILIAERCGLDLLPVALPRHFLVACYDEKPIFFIDSFARGTFCSKEQILDRLRTKKGTPCLSHLTPTPVREVLTRCCRNLAYHYSIQNDQSRSRLFSDFVHEFENTYKRNISS